MVDVNSIKIREFKAVSKYNRSWFVFFLVMHRVIVQSPSPRHVNKTHSTHNYTGTQDITQPITIIFAKRVPIYIISHPGLAPSTPAELTHTPKRSNS